MVYTLKIYPSSIDPEEIRELGSLITQKELERYNKINTLVYKWQQISLRHILIQNQGLEALAKTLSQFASQHQDYPKHAVHFELRLFSDRETTSHAIGIGVDPPSFMDPNDISVITHKPLTHIFSSLEKMIEYAIFWIAFIYPEYKSFDLFKYIPKFYYQAELVQITQEWKELKTKLEHLNEELKLEKNEDSGASITALRNLTRGRLYKISKLLAPLLQTELQRIEQKKKLIEDRIDLSRLRKDKLIYSYDILRQENMNLLEEVNQALKH